MREFIIDDKNNGKHLVRYLTAQFPQVPFYLFQKALKNKDIAVNGKRIKADLILSKNDCVRIYIKDEDLQLAQSKSKMAASQRTPIVYEDKNILIINKPQGLTVHPGQNTEQEGTLIEQLREEYNNPQLTLFHRLDRNTGGLVILTKNKVALGKLNEALANQQIVKRYRCLVRGIPEVGTEVRLQDGDTMLETKAFWERPSHSDLVYVHSEKQVNDLPMITRYRVLKVYTDLTATGEPISELEVELVTGRTHQIRAHFNFLGHPVVGDGKYGRNEFNLQFRSKDGSKITVQQLFATSLLFGSQLPSGLELLKNKTFTILPSYKIMLR